MDRQADSHCFINVGTPFSVAEYRTGVQLPKVVSIDQPRGPPCGIPSSATHGTAVPASRTPMCTDAARFAPETRFLTEEVYTLHLCLV